MLKKSLVDNNGAAAAEFALSLLVLMPLLFWMIRFGELMNVHCASIEAARLAAWERAYGRTEDEIKGMVEKTIKSAATFSGNPNVSVSTTFSTETSKNDFRVVSQFGVPDRLGLRYGNYHKVKIDVNGTLPLGVDYVLTRRHMLLTDPWNLTDQNGDRSITDAEDFDPTIYKLYFYEPITKGLVSDMINWIFDISGSIQGLWSPVLGLTGNSLDIEPRGYPTLESVPKPSGN